MHSRFFVWSLVPACFALGLWGNRMLAGKPADKPNASTPRVVAKPSPAESDGSAPGPVLAHLRKSHQPMSSGRPATEKSNGLIYDDFPLDPFPVTQSNNHHSWTGNKAMDRKSIDALAHNDHERERLLTENLYVVRRELVYRKVPFRELAEAQLALGTELKTVVLPGFDGKEYEVIVDRWEASPPTAKEREGVMSGHLKDDPESEVHLAYYEGSETGSIISKKLGLTIGIDPREPNQIVLKEIDPHLLAIHEEGQTCGVKYGSNAVGAANSLPE